MLVLIDESGCSGFKLDNGSTPYFIVAMVIFADFLEAEKASIAIANLRQELNIWPEFKFAKTHSEVKDIFFKTINPYNFLIRSLVVEKRYVYSSHMRKQKENFYNYFIKALMKHDGKLLTNASVKIDGGGDKGFRNALSSYLRQEIGSNKIKKFRFIDSRQDNLIQLADMVVGAIARHHNRNRKDASRWYNMLKNKIDDIWNFTETRSREVDAYVP
jgi:hypothetical protein